MAQFKAPGPGAAGAPPFGGEGFSPSYSSQQQSSTPEFTSRVFPHELGRRDEPRPGPPGGELSPPGSGPQQNWPPPSGQQYGAFAPTGAPQYNTVPQGGEYIPQNPGVRPPTSGAGQPAGADTNFGPGASAYPGFGFGANYGPSTGTGYQGGYAAGYGGASGGVAPGGQAAAPGAGFSGGMAPAAANAVMGGAATIGAAQAKTNNGLRNCNTLTGTIHSSFIPFVGAHNQVRTPIRHQWVAPSVQAVHNATCDPTTARTMNPTAMGLAPPSHSAYGYPAPGGTMLPGGFAGTMGTCGPVGPATYGAGSGLGGGLPGSVLQGHVAYAYPIGHPAGPCSNCGSVPGSPADIICATCSMPLKNHLGEPMPPEQAKAKRDAEFERKRQMAALAATVRQYVAAGADTHQVTELIKQHATSLRAAGAGAGPGAAPGAFGQPTLRARKGSL
eukprot:TRINITY_DN13409_c0_g1_i1.p2 TRINITY_DN13409_c0_g1~~TRINITY_DN13409_c0_g1_i1.p2  ORF type:complete len:444 (-),score=69.91 TRINITY_DN13409_c0_g1_i1:447-1778(-)